MAVDSRMYVCTFDVTAATVAVDFFEFTPADDKPIVLHALYIAQTTEAGDAMEEMLPWSIQRGGSAMTTGSGGVAATNGVVLGPSGATSGFTFEAMNTTAASFTGGVVVHRDAFNVRVGLQYIPTPETRISCSQANGGFVVRLGAAPADSISWTGSALIEEQG
jgi:hypothetical protein